MCHIMGAKVLSPWGMNLLGDEPELSQHLGCSQVGTKVLPSWEINLLGDEPELSQPPGCSQMGAKVLPSSGINLLGGRNQSYSNLWDVPDWVLRCYHPGE